MHFWKIHARVCKRIWAELDSSVKAVVAADADHETFEFRSFNRGVDMEAERLFQNPNYFMNDPFTFKYSA